MFGKLLRLILLIATVSMAGCSDSFDFDDDIVPGKPGTITIRISNSTPTRSKQSDDSENKIDNLVVGLYPATDNGTNPAVLWKVFKNLKQSGEATVSLQMSTDIENALFGGIDGAKCRMFVLANLEEPDDVPEKASINQLKQYSVTSPFDTKSVQTDFVMTGEGELEYTSPIISSVQGTAEGLCPLYRAAAKIRLNLSLPESVDIKDAAGNVTERWFPVTDENAISVLINNGVKSAVASPMPDEDNNPWKPAELTAYYNSSLSSDNSFRTLSLTTNAEYPYRMDVPLYTYPNAWTEDVDETSKTTLTLIVPWRKTTDASSQYSVFYYQVPVTPADLPRIDRNYSYMINLNVDMLGSSVPDAPFELDNLSYQVVDWGQEDVDISIPDYRYLVVNPNVYTFNNEANMAVPYYSSHPVEIVDVKIKYQRFNFISDVENDDVGRVVEFTIDDEQIERTNTRYPDTPICTNSLSESGGQKYINISHPLNLWTPCDVNDVEVSLINHTQLSDTTSVANRISYYKPEKDDAFSMYTITLTVRHVDKPEFKEDIVIYQYPAIYIEAYRNPATKPEGNIFVNTFTNVRATHLDGVPSYGSSTGITWGDANNKNPNMYIINITTISEDITFTVEDQSTGEVTTYNYVIGDPRSKFWTNRFKTTETEPDLWTNQKTRTDNSEPTTKSWCIPAPALYTSPDIGSAYTEAPDKRTLAYYYITLEDGTVTNMVAPKFRVASSWGVTSSISRVYARYRAALYQENAFPAGRWRIPTVAEFSYINKLSGEGKIPQLFTYNRPYWTSDGLYMGDRTGKIYRAANQADKRAVRAVYDEWYWSQYPQFTISPDELGEYTYILGDVPRGIQ